MGRNFKFKQFIAGNCFSYILSSLQEAVIIDPHISLNEDYSKYLNKNKIKLKYVIDTHTHADHFSLAATLKERYKVPVLMHEKAVSEVVDIKVKDGTEIVFGNKRFNILYAPGHTDDTVNIHGEDKIFTADVLLIGSVGRTDFQNGSPESMFDTLQKLKKLPDNTKIFPAHDYNQKKYSTIGTEKETNPFMKEISKDLFVQNARSKNLPKPFNIDNIIRVNQKGQAKTIQMISPKDAFALISVNPQVKLLDVRSALEFNETHLADSINVPIDMLSLKINTLSQNNEAYIVFCRTGNRSPMAADMLLQSGISSVKVMEGGLTAWQKEKLPVIKGQGGMSLERQVRVIAGSLMILGIALAWLINWAFIFISVWVACGLIFAGLTDNCLMGIMLMKLPYNKKRFNAATGGGTCSISQ